MAAIWPWSSTPASKASREFHYLDGGKRGKAKRRAASKRARIARRRNR